MRRNERGSPKSSSLLTVYNAIGIIILLYARITLCRPDRWLLVAFNDLLWEVVRNRSRDFLDLFDWEYRCDRTTFGKRLFNQEFSTPLRNLSSQMITKIGKVLIWVLGCHGVCKGLYSLLKSLILNSLP